MYIHKVKKSKQTKYCSSAINIDDFELRMRCLRKLACRLPVLT